jgi:hypothetical protein
VVKNESAGPSRTSDHHHARRTLTAIRFTADRRRRLLLAAPIWLAMPSRAVAAPLVIARPDESPAPMMLDIQRRVQAAYRQIGIETVVASLPPLRSGALAKADKVDAELLRVQLPNPRSNFLQVATPLVSFQVMALTHGKDLTLAAPAALRHYRVVVPAGIFALEDVARRARTVERAPDYDAGERMLVQGRVDVALQLATNPERAVADFGASWQQLDIRVANMRLAQYMAYHYVSPRHRDLLPALAEAFRTQGLPVQP